MTRARLSPCIIWREKEFKHHQGSSKNPVQGRLAGVQCKSAIGAVRASLDRLRSDQPRFPPDNNPICCVLIPGTGQQCRSPSCVGAHCVRHNSGGAWLQRCYVLPVCEAHHPKNTNVQHFTFTCARNTVGCLDREQDFDEYSRRRATPQQITPEKQAQIDAANAALGKAMEKALQDEQSQDDIENESYVASASSADGTPNGIDFLSFSCTYIDP
ncbi:hypothetical protein ABBQ38_005617 [Trebouxia sp. C0009 RCD-2024]